MSLQWPLLAQSGHPTLRRTCPLLGVKRTWPAALHMSAYDPKRTFGSRRCLLVTLRGRRVLERAVVESGDARLIRIRNAGGA